MSYTKIILNFPQNKNYNVNLVKCKRRKYIYTDIQAGPCKEENTVCDFVWLGSFRIKVVFGGKRVLRKTEARQMEFGKKQGSEHLRTLNFILRQRPLKGVKVRKEKEGEWKEDRDEGRECEMFIFHL